MPPVLTRPQMNSGSGRLASRHTIPWVAYSHAWIPKACVRAFYAGWRVRGANDTRRGRRRQDITSFPWSIRGQKRDPQVSAWATTNRVVLGQTKTAEKSNEITAIPELLKLLAIDGCIVMIDAMGCRTEIAKTIIDQEADYVLALKGAVRQAPRYCWRTSAAALSAPDGPSQTTRPFSITKL